MSSPAIGRERPYLKWSFFAILAACVLLVISVDERFLVVASDPEWKHIAPFKWLLLFHGLAGATALFIGPFQFSDRLRRAQPQVHRWMGRLYVGSILLIAAPLGGWIGVHFEPRTIYIEQYFQAGFWWLTTAIALICIFNGQLVLHRRWMMRSYGFCAIFILSRVPDAFMHMGDQMLSDVLWSLVIAALITPDLIQTGQELLQQRRRRRALAIPASRL